MDAPPVIRRRMVCETDAFFFVKHLQGFIEQGWWCDTQVLHRFLDAQVLHRFLVAHKIPTNKILTNILTGTMESLFTGQQLVQVSVVIAYAIAPIRLCSIMLNAKHRLRCIDCDGCS
jgi:hypothetical protein